jgi:uncharacterized protein (TIGR03083 family)
MPGDGVELADWFSDGAERLLGLLDDDPARPAWSFDPEGQTLQFWQRRQAMENVVHRVDIEAALGGMTGVPPDLAADGVSEAVEVMVRLRVDAGDLVLPPDRCVELRADDTGHTWRLGGGLVVASATGRAEQVFLVLWKRLPSDELILGGDPLAVGAILDLPLTP